jgi:hypothetical protein
MESNNLCGGEELSMETCFKHLYITFKSYLVTDPEKDEKFRLLTGNMINQGVIRAVRHDQGKIEFFYNKNLITKSEFLCLLANVYVRFFGTSLAMKTYVSIGCVLFDCSGKKKDSIYMAMKRHKNNEIPVPYTKFF